jgi:hypothetical protein
MKIPEYVKMHSMGNTHTPIYKQYFVEQNLIIIYLVLPQSYMKLKSDFISFLKTALVRTMLQDVYIDKIHKFIM